MTSNKILSAAAVCLLSTLVSAGGITGGPSASPSPASPSSPSSSVRGTGPFSGNDGVGGIERVPLGVARSSTAASGPAPGLTELPDAGATELWENLGMALAGAAGEPRLEGSGKVVPGNTVVLRVEQAKPAASAILIVGYSEALVPFKGGTMVPSNNLVIGGLMTNDAGIIEFPVEIPVTMPAGAQIYMQTWIADDSGPVGVAATNGLKMTSAD